MERKQVYTVEIHVGAYALVEVEASSPEEAEEIAEKNFVNGDPLIDDSEYVVEYNAQPKENKINEKS